MLNYTIYSLITSQKLMDNPLNLNTVLKPFVVKNNKKAFLIASQHLIIFFAALLFSFYLFSTQRYIGAFATSLLVGFELSALALLGHDTAHIAFFESRLLNEKFSKIFFTLCFYNVDLWKQDHHKLHHPSTNGGHIDSFKPIDYQDYKKLTFFGKIWHRFTRSGSFLMFGLYYIACRWSKVKIYPLKSIGLNAEAQKSAMNSFIVVLMYLTSIIAVEYIFVKGDLSLLLKALFLFPIIPFFVFQTLMGWALYINHTHPDIPWTNEVRFSKVPQYQLTAEYTFPSLIEFLTLGFLIHSAHHVNPGIPCYNLRAAQNMLNQLIPACDRIVVKGLSLEYFKIAKICKLYDYDNQQWLDYEGNVVYKQKQ